MNCIRIEHTIDGWGLFRRPDEDTFALMGFIFQEILWEIRVRHGEFSTPYIDGLNLNQHGKEWFCAYKTVEQIQKWIEPHEFKSIIDNGFNIYLLTVEEFQEGNDQIIYTKESIISKKEINSLFL